MLNIGIFVYSATSTNIGDPIQSLVNANAWANLLGNVQLVYETPRLQLLFGRCNPALKNEARPTRGVIKVWEIERDKTSEIVNKIGPNSTIHVVFNGWFLHGHDWPPPPCVIPIFASFHVNSVNTVLTPTGIEYLKKHSPIGCRDPATTRLLRSKGINTWFSGCLTMTMNDIFHVKPNAKRSGIYIVDTKVNVQRKAKEAIYYVNHTVNMKAMHDPFDYAFQLLKKYSTASRIFSSRLHCVIPSLALGTNVKFVSKSGIMDDSAMLSGPRYSGLANLALNAKSRKYMGKKLQRHLVNRLCLVIAAAQNSGRTLIATDQACVVEIYQKHMCFRRIVYSTCALTVDLSKPINWPHINRFLFPVQIGAAIIHSEPAPALLNSILENSRPAFIQRPAQSQEFIEYIPRLAKPVVKRKNYYNIVFTCDKNYIEHVGTVLHSIQKMHRTPQDNVVFKAFVILRGITANDACVNKLRAQVFAHLDIFDLFFIESKQNFKYSNNLAHVTMSCLDRLLIPALIFEKIVLYLDLDILCTGSILDIFKLKIGAQGLVAKNSVKQNVVGRWLQKMNSKLSYTHATSVNAGVMLMDLHKLRKLNFSSKTIGICEKFQVNDQIAVNIFLQGKGNTLPAKFNFFFGQENRTDTKKIKAPAIIHYAGSVKPWHSGFADQAHSALWKSYQLPAL